MKFFLLTLCLFSTVMVGFANNDVPKKQNKPEFKVEIPRKPEKLPSKLYKEKLVDVIVDTGFENKNIGRNDYD